jgi:hypothetical protein
VAHPEQRQRVLSRGHDRGGEAEEPVIVEAGDEYRAEA